MMNVFDARCSLRLNISLLLFLSFTEFSHV